MGWHEPNERTVSGFEIDECVWAFAVADVRCQQVHFLSKCHYWKVGKQGANCIRHSTEQKVQSLWPGKTQISTSRTSTALQRTNPTYVALQNIMTQVSSILGDNERLVKRTQLKRTEYQPLGKVNSIQDICNARQVNECLTNGIN